jgi:hypothetical protein
MDYKKEALHAVCEVISNYESYLSPEAGYQLFAEWLRAHDARLLRELAASLTVYHDPFSTSLEGRDSDDALICYGSMVKENTIARWLNDCIAELEREEQSNG